MCSGEWDTDISRLLGDDFLHPVVVLLVPPTICFSRFPVAKRDIVESTLVAYIRQKKSFYLAALHLLGTILPCVVKARCSPLLLKLLQLWVRLRGGATLSTHSN